MATIKAVFKAVDEISEKFDSMTRSGERALEAFEDVGAAADGALGRASTTASETAQSLGEAADAADRAADEVGKFGEQSEQAGGQGEEFGKKSGDAIKSLKEILFSAGIVAGLKQIGEAFVECAKDSIEFESAITGVFKTVDGTDEQLAAITAEVKDLSTEIPATTTEIAAVAEAAGQLGIATDDVMEFTEVMINLGESTNLSADEAASALAKFSNITGTSAEDYERLGSTIVALGNNFATTEADITAMATRMASAGTLAGMTEADILALASSLSSVGIEADAGGSAMSTLMSKMQLAVETGNEQLEQFASVSGYTASEFQQAWGEDAAGALYAFISGLNDTERNGASATAVLDEMGITEIRLSNAIKALANDSDNLGNALDFASNAWEENSALAKEAGTRYGTLESKLAMTKNAANNLSVAVGDVFNPVIADGSEFLTDMLNGLTAFVEENPAVVAAVTAIAIGVGVFAAALAGYTLATNIASVATAAWNAILAMNPVFLIIMGVVALTAAVVALVAVLASQNDEYEEMTATSKDTYDQLQELNAEYEEACAVYGETSEEASRLRYEMEELEAEFEANRQTVEEFVAECEELVSSHNELMDSYNSTTSELRQNELGTLALIQKLEDLASQNVKTAATEEQMRAIIQQLNADLPELALSYEDVATNVDAAVDAMRRAAEEQAKTEMQTEQQQAYVDLLKDQAALEEQIAKAEANLAAERERLGMYQDSTGAWTNGWYMEESPWADWTTDLDEYGDALTSLETAYAENQAAIAGIEEEWEEVAQAALEAEEAVVSYEDAMSTAVEVVKTDLEALCEEYDAAYESARESIDGQIGLFETMKTESALSVEEMGAALQSQAEYLALYTENLQKASEYGISDGLVQSLSDGSAESAGYIDAIIAEVERLGPGTEAANAFVEDFNAKFSEVDQAKDEFAANVAAMETDFDARMGEIEARMTTAVDNMNMETDAAAAARATITAYCDTIRSMTGEASSAAAAVASAAAQHLSGSGYTTVPGHAEGTTYAEDVFVAGEEGPELIIGARGSTVFPAEETSRILAAVERPVETSGGAVVYESAPETGSGETGSGERTVKLEINGGGAITVDKGADKSTILQVLVENVKPVLMGIIREEILEEGEMTYAY